MRVVGHPPLDEVFAYKNSPPSQCECNLLRGELDIPERTPFTVYLEDALVELGNPNWTSDERIRHLQELAGICGEAGRLLIVKLHPLTPAKPIQDALAGHPAARIVQKTNLPLLVYLAESAIGHISTTVNIPICLGKPVLSTRWGYTERAPDCFGKEGVVAVCNTAAELRHAIQDPSNAYRSHGDRLRKYIDDFITHTDGRSRDRIVESLLEQASLCCQGSTPRMPQRASAA
jgi:hypothetical protein